MLQLLGETRAGAISKTVGPLWFYHNRYIQPTFPGPHIPQSFEEFCEFQEQEVSAADSWATVTKDPVWGNDIMHC